MCSLDLAFLYIHKNDKLIILIILKIMSNQTKTKKKTLNCAI